MRTTLALGVFLLVSALFPTGGFADPGSYSLRVKGGPSFPLNDWEAQGRIGGEFDYDFGYSMGFNLMGQFGISDTFRFDLIPSFRYDYLYIGPAIFYAVVGMGYTVLDDQSALGVRTGSGLKLPLGDRFEFNTDANFFFVPAGTPGTQISLDWLIGIGVRYF